MSPIFFSLGFVIYWFHTKLPRHILQQNCAHGGMTDVDQIVRPIQYMNTLSTFRRKVPGWIMQKSQQ